MVRWLALVIVALLAPTCVREVRNQCLNGGQFYPCTCPSGEESVYECNGTTPGDCECQLQVDPPPGSGCQTAADCPAYTSCADTLCWCIQGECRSPTYLFTGGHPLPGVIGIEGILIVETQTDDEKSVRTTATGSAQIFELRITESNSLNVHLAGSATIALTFAEELLSCSLVQAACENYAEFFGESFSANELGVPCEVVLTPWPVEVGQVTWANNTEDRRGQGFEYEIRCDGENASVRVHSVNYGNSIWTFGSSDDPGCAYGGCGAGAEAGYGRCGREKVQWEFTGSYKIFTGTGGAAEWPLVDNNVTITSDDCP